jgi:site-specific recombinase XerD
MPAEVIDFSTRTRRRPARRSPAVPRGADLAVLLDSWELALRAASKSRYTIRSYGDTARNLIRYLTEHHLPRDAEGVQVEHIRAFLAHETERTSAASAGHAFRNLSVFWNWLCDPEQGERTQPSPVSKKDRPIVPKKVRRYLTPDQIRALLKACEGDTFEARRDRAIIYVLADNGMRASGLAGILLEDVELKARRVKIRLKGGDEHWAPVGAKTAAALDKYIRARSRHRLARSSPYLWLGVTGRRMAQMSASGMYQMLERRGLQAGVRVHPHMFRGTAAHQLLANGADSGDVQHILGWRDRSMVDHYAGDLARDRARETHGRVSPADRL